MNGKIMPCSSVMVGALLSTYICTPFHQLFSDNRIERRLEEDEQPLLLFQKLKEAAKKPVFRLKNIKTNFNSSVTTEDTIEHNKAQSINRPAKLEANDIQTSPSGLVPEPEWSVAIDPYMTVQDGEFGATF